MKWTNERHSQWTSPEYSWWSLSISKAFSFYLLWDVETNEIKMTMYIDPFAIWRRWSVELVDWDELDDGDIRTLDVFHRSEEEQKTKMAMNEKNRLEGGNEPAVDRFVFVLLNHFSFVSIHRLLRVKLRHCSLYVFDNSVRRSKKDDDDDEWRDALMEEKIVLLYFFPDDEYLWWYAFVRVLNDSIVLNVDCILLYSIEWYHGQLKEYLHDEAILHPVVLDYSNAYSIDERTMAKWHVHHVRSGEISCSSSFNIILRSSYFLQFRWKKLSIVMKIAFEERRFCTGIESSSLTSITDRMFIIGRHSVEMIRRLIFIVQREIKRFRWRMKKWTFLLHWIKKCWIVPLPIEIGMTTGGMIDHRSFWNINRHCWKIGEIFFDPTLRKRSMNHSFIDPDELT